MLNPGRLLSVDSLRGIAVLMVVAVHTSGFKRPTSVWLLTLAQLGARGVQLFYVVSAFTLYLSYEQRKSAGGFSFRGYFIRRVSRIAPMFWLAVVLDLAVFGMGPKYWAPDGITPMDAVLTVLFLTVGRPQLLTQLFQVGGVSLLKQCSI